MFCHNCGAEVKDDAQFCPMCGTHLNHAQPGVEPAQPGPDPSQTRGAQPQPGIDPVQTWAGQAQAGFGQAQSEFGQAQPEGDPNGKKDIKSLLTKENIERFAPMAAFFPPILFMIRLIFGILLSLMARVIWNYTVLRIVIVISSLLNIILFIIFCLGALAAAAGLIYVALDKDRSSAWTWITPGIVLLAAIACIGQFLGWGIFSFILGLISVVFAVDFLARIVIADKPMNTPIDPSKDLAVYSEFIQKYKAEHPKTDAAAGPAFAAGTTEVAVANNLVIDSYFDGSGFELFGLTLLSSLVSLITCGIALPWMLCKVYRWRIGHTVINGKRLTFDGSGGSLFGHWILWSLLTVITCGIYGFFAAVALKKWELSHTFIEGEPIVPNVTVSYFDGNSFQMFGYELLSILISLVTCMIGMPWGMCMLQNWQTKHMVVNGRRMKFDGTGLGFLGEYIIIALLTLVTCGIYSSWGIVRMNKYVIRHTYFEA